MHRLCRLGEKIEYVLTWDPVAQRSGFQQWGTQNTQFAEK